MNNPSITYAHLLRSTAAAAVATGRRRTGAGAAHAAVHATRAAGRQPESGRLLLASRRSRWRATAADELRCAALDFRSSVVRSRIVARGQLVHAARSDDHNFVCF